jgi:hypothetical protein
MDQAVKGLSDLALWAKFAETVGAPATICVVFMLLVFWLLALFLWLFCRPFAKFLNGLLAELAKFGATLERIYGAIDKLEERQANSDERHETRFKGLETALGDIKQQIGGKQ